MLRFPKKIIYLTLLMTLSVFIHVPVSYSQDNEPVGYSQDSIFNNITNIKTVFDKDNESYFQDYAVDHELRYNQLSQDSQPGSYMDIINNPMFEEMGYSLTYQDTMIVTSMGLPVTFSGKVLPEGYPLLDPTKGPAYNPFSEKLNRNASPLYGPYDPYVSSLGIKSRIAFDKELYTQELRRNAYQYLAYHNPRLVTYLPSDFPNEIEKAEQLKANPFKEIFKVDNSADFTGVEGPDKFVPKRRYWIVSGQHLLQFSQNYISDNWYKGGTGNLNFFSNQVMTTKFEKGKLKFNNELQWKLSLYTNPNDSLREIKIGEDLVRNYAEFGIKAFGDKWSYATNLEIKTQLFRNYKENTNIRQSSFLSPLLVNMGILGMKYETTKTYKSDKYKKMNVKVDISPLSVKYSYVADDEVSVTSYGIQEGKRHLTELGSSLNSTLKYDFSRFITFQSRFKYFTNYNAVEIESENELNMAINRYFSTRIYLYLRFDDADGRKSDPKLGYFQVNETLSFGFNYKW